MFKCRWLTLAFWRPSWQEIAAIAAGIEILLLGKRYQWHIVTALVALYMLGIFLISKKVSDFSEVRIRLTPRLPDSRYPVPNQSAHLNEVEGPERTILELLSNRSMLTCEEICKRMDTAHGALSDEQRRLALAALHQRKIIAINPERKWFLLQ